jgi:peptide chain release factor subunit 1
LAGSADFKNDLNTSQMFDPRLATKVVKIVDVSYGGENGLNQAIELSQESLHSIKFVQEKKLVGKFFEEIATDSGKYVYGLQETMKSLEAGAIETMMVYEGSDVHRIELKNKESAMMSVIYLRPD